MIEQPSRGSSRSALLAAGAALGNLLQGFNTGVIAGALLGIEPEFGIAQQPEVTGLIVSSSAVGAMFGTAGGGFLCDAAGRKAALVVSSALFLLSGALMCWSPTVALLVAGRIVSGLAIGIVSAAAPTYIAECAEPSQRGALSIYPQFAFSTGVLLSYLVAFWVLVLGRSWRLMLGASLVPACAQAVCLLALPESPRWLVWKAGDGERALASLRRLRGHEDVHLELAAVRAGLAHEKASSTAARRCCTGQDGTATRRALFVCGTLQCFSQLSGVNAILYFTPKILKEAGVESLFLGRAVTPDAAAMLATTLAYCPKLPAVFIALFLIDSQGRRWMLHAFVPPLAACLLLLATTVSATTATPLTAICATLSVTLFGAFFGMSLGSVPQVLAAELFPTSTRGVGVAATVTIQFVTHVAVAALFPVASQRLGTSPVLCSFAVACVLAWVFSAAFVPETKGVALEQIGASQSAAGGTPLTADQHGGLDGEPRRARLREGS